MKELWLTHIIPYYGVDHQGYRTTVCVALTPTTRQLAFNPTRTSKVPIVLLENVDGVVKSKIMDRWRTLAILTNRIIREFNDEIR